MTDSSDADCEMLKRLRDAPELFAAIAERREESELAKQQRLRAQWPDDLLRAALTLAELRERAATKFTRADRMWFDRTGLEQATPEPVARWKASRFAAQGIGEPVWDLCSGIGGDVLALAEQLSVVSFDTSPVQNLRAVWNAEVYGVSERVTTRTVDVTTLDDIPGYVHCDPDRRAGLSGRARRLEDYVPPLDWLQALTERVRGGAIKVGPASNFGGKFPDAEIELISLDGECKEATIWFGELCQPGQYRATVLPAGQTVIGHPLENLASRSGLKTYLYDPDPAVVRAGLVERIAEDLGLSRLDEAEEYLTGDTLVDSPFVSPFRVVAELPKRPRDLRDWFRKSDFGQLEIKCRHVPVRAEELRSQLPLPGNQPGVLFVARVAGKTTMIAAERPPTNLP